MHALHEWDVQPGSDLAVEGSLYPRRHRADETQRRSLDAGITSAAAPDPLCAFWLGNSSASQTSTLSNTFAPAWNESITPGSRFSASLLSSQSNPWSIRVIDEDQLGMEIICSVSPALDAAAFTSGLASFSAGSCTTLEVGLECVAQ